MPTVFDVKAFGALGDSSTHDTAAFQAAVDAAVDAKGLVVVPVLNPGEFYALEGTVSFGPRTRIMGLGGPAGVHLRQMTAGQTLLQFVGSSEQESLMAFISCLELYGPTGSACG